MPSALKSCSYLRDTSQLLHSSIRLICLVKLSSTRGDVRMTSSVDPPANRSYCFFRDLRVHNEEYRVMVE